MKVREYPWSTQGEWQEVQQLVVSRDASGALKWLGEFFFAFFVFLISCPSLVQTCGRVEDIFLNLWQPLGSCYSARYWLPENCG
jgi:hypothetical protein